MSAFTPKAASRRNTAGSVAERLSAQYAQTMIERGSEQRGDFRDEIGRGGEALPCVVARLTIPDLEHRKTIGTIKLSEDAVAQKARTVGIGCRGAVGEQLVLPLLHAAFLQQLDIGDDVQRA